MELENRINDLLNAVILIAENSNEFLIGRCESEISLTNTQEHILMLLLNEKMTNSTLAETLNVSQAAVTKAVRVLLSKGFIASMKDSTDARVTYYFLTEAAMPIAREHFSHHKKTLATYSEIISHFSIAEQQLIERFLLELKKGIFDTHEISYR